MLRDKVCSDARQLTLRAARDAHSMSEKRSQVKGVRLEQGATQDLG